MAHPIRFTMRPELPDDKKLWGVVDCDESFLGGKGDKLNTNQGKRPFAALDQRNAN